MVGIHFSIFKRNCIQHSHNVKLFAHTVESHDGPGVLIHIFIVSTEGVARSVLG